MIGRLRELMRDAGEIARGAQTIGHLASEQQRLERRVDEIERKLECGYAITERLYGRTSVHGAHRRRS